MLLSWFENYLGVGHVTALNSGTAASLGLILLGLRLAVLASIYDFCGLGKSCFLYQGQPVFY
jgi:dTDP-4-amino-4,6-dideoxygalactose transaminase